MLILNIYADWKNNVQLESYELVNTMRPQNRIIFFYNFTLIASKFVKLEEFL